MSILPTSLSAIELRDVGYSISIRHSQLNSIEDQYDFPTNSVVGDVEANNSSYKNDDANTRHILRNVNMNISSGELVAILGPSGSGKSTLMNIIGGRCKGGRVKGNVKLFGQTYSNRERKLRCAFIPQQDLMLPFLSVTETLEIAAKLRLPSSMSCKDQTLRVNEVISDLGLTKVSSTRIGSEYIRGVSGGERKRVAIGCELVSNPSLLLADEPTSGLDSSNAFLLVLKLKNLVQSLGCTVIITIHQPSSAVYHLFDRMLLLSPSGSPAFCGISSNAVEFIEQTCSIKMPHATNPADFILAAVTRRHLDSHTQWEEKTLQLFSNSDTNIEQLTTACLHSSRLVMPDNTTAGTHTSSMSTVPATNQSLDYAVGFKTQFVALLRRSTLNTLRDPTQTIVSSMVAIFFGLLVGSLFWQQGIDNASIRNRFGVLFLIAMNGSFSNMSALALLLNGRAQFMRERDSLYTASAFYLAKIIPDIPLRLIQPTIISAICYVMIGLRPQISAFFCCWIIVCLLSLVSYSLCLAVSSLVSSFAVANIVTPLFIVLCLLPSGLIAQLNSLPAMWAWLKYVSFFRYAYEALVVNEFEGAVFKNGVQGSRLVLEQGLELGVFWRNVFMLIVMVSVLQIFSFLGMRYRKFGVKAAK